MEHSDSQTDENLGAEAVPDPGSEGDGSAPGGGLECRETPSSHTWKILIISAIALIAVAWFFLAPDPLYESHAKLLVHYVVESDETGQTIANIRYKKAILNDEIELLRSWDLASAVAKSGTIDLEKLLPDSEGEASDRTAGVAISEGLDVGRLPESKILLVSFRHSDPEVPVSVLRKIIEQYLQNHLDTHRRDSRMLLETERLKCQHNLRQTEMQISEIMGDVFSIEAEQDHFATRKRKAVDSLVDARADLAMQAFRLEGFGVLPDNASSGTEKLPDVSGSKGEPGSDAEVEIANFKQSQNRIKILQVELDDAQAGLADLATRATRLAPLLRTKAAVEARIAALDVSQVNAERYAALRAEMPRNGLPNIAVIESPTPPAKVTPNWGKRASLLLAAGGIALGIALALMIARKLFFRLRRPQAPVG